MLIEFIKKQLKLGNESIDAIFDEQWGIVTRVSLV